MGDLKPLLGEVAGGNKGLGSVFSVFSWQVLCLHFSFFQLFCGVLNSG